MGQKFVIFIILLWISLTFNLESNEMYSYVLVFYFFTNVTDYLAYFWQNGNILLSLGSKSKTLLQLYKQHYGWIQGVNPMFM